jgi:hypothetical protein
MNSEDWRLCPSKSVRRNDSGEGLNEINHPPLIMRPRGIIQIKMASFVKRI